MVENHPDTRKQEYRGIACLVLSAFCFALMSMFVHLAGDLPSMQKSFFRNLVAALAAVVLLLRAGEPFRIRRENLPYFLMRSIFGTMGVLCNFYAVDHLVLADASILNKMSPFFTVLFSWLILKEKCYANSAFADLRCVSRQYIRGKADILQSGTCAVAAGLFRRHLRGRGVHDGAETGRGRRKGTGDRAVFLGIFLCGCAAVADFSTIIR